jgi:protease-4
MMYSIDKLMKSKLGVTFDEVKNAPYADIPTVSRPLTPEEGQRMQNSVDTVYALFKRHVSEGRHLAPADVDSIAQGRVWTGADAMGIGLVDGLGGLDRAIASAAKMANVTDYKVVTYPEPSDKLNSILRKFGVTTSNDEALRAALKSELGTGYEWLDKLRSLNRMNGKAMMAMPFVLTVE